MSCRDVIMLLDATVTRQPRLRLPEAPLREAGEEAASRFVRERTPVRMDPYYVADTNGSPEYEIAVGGTTPNAVPAPPHPYPQSPLLEDLLGDLIVFRA